MEVVVGKGVLETKTGKRDLLRTATIDERGEIIINWYIK